MDTLDSMKKELLLRQVRQQGHSIRIGDIVKLIVRYDILKVEDFAPPVLPPEMYEQLKEFFTNSQEEEDWKQLLQKPRTKLEEVSSLINNIECYISSYESLTQSHVNEAFLLLNELREQYDVLKMQESQKTWQPSVHTFADAQIVTPNPFDMIRRSCASAMPPTPKVEAELNVYLYVGGQQYGPYKRDICKQFVENGQLTKQTLVWMEGMTTWLPAEQVAEFQQLFGIELRASPIVTPSPPPLDTIIVLTSTNRVKEQEESYVYSSVFAPAEVKPRTHMLVQVYLHLFEETEKVKALAQESQKDAERRDYIPLQCKLKKGDRVDVQLSIYGETLLMSEKKSVVWQGSFTKCSFDYFVPKDIDVDELSCVAMLTVNGVPVGEMRFITRIVERPRQLNPEIIVHKYNKVFISYAHKDEAQVKSFHEGLKLAGIDHFFDRNYLKVGDIFPQVIQDYINTADLFVLFWSENASKSEYVQKERTQALERAFPQVKPQQAAKLSIYPMSIEPRAELPSDMKENYHFGEI